MLSQTKNPFFRKAVLLLAIATMTAFGTPRECRDDLKELGANKDKHSWKTKALSAAGALVATVGAGLAWGLSTKEHRGQVQRTSWQHSIEVQDFQKITREAWCDGLVEREPVMPENGQDERPGLWNIKDLGDRLSHTAQILTGFDSNNTPQYFYMPIYKRWCSYQTYAWVSVRTESTQGLDPKPGEGPLPDPQVTLARYERQLPMKRTYSVEIHYEREGKELVHLANPAEESDFRELIAGTRMIVTRNNFGRVRKVRKE